MGTEEVSGKPGKLNILFWSFTPTLRSSSATGSMNTTTTALSAGVPAPASYGAAYTH